MSKKSTHVVPNKDGGWDIQQSGDGASIDGWHESSLMLHGLISALGCAFIVQMYVRMHA